MMAWIPWLRRLWISFHRTQESPQLLFVDVSFADLVQKIMVDRWNSFNTPLHTLAHALNPRFYDEQLIAQSNGKRKAPHQDREVVNGVKKIPYENISGSSTQLSEGRIC